MHVYNLQDFILQIAKAMKDRLIFGGKLTHVLCCLLVLHNVQPKAQGCHNYVATEEANLDFKELNALLLYDENDTSWRVTDPIVKARYIAINEKKRMLYREHGIKIWHKYPKDPRRYEWFIRNFAGIGYLNNYYWKNIDSGAYKHELIPLFTSYSTPMDFEMLTRHEKFYPSMRAEYFRWIDRDTSLSAKAKVLAKNKVFVNELESFLKLSRNVEYRHGKKIDMARLKKLVWMAFPSANTVNLTGMISSRDGTFVLRAMDNDFLANYEHFGLSYHDVYELIKTFSMAENENLRHWASQRLSLLALKENPIDFECTAISGKVIDLKKMRGKVVLLDFWSTGCSSCIERMPAIKEVYDRFKARGFEVISLCINSADEIEQIRRIEKKIGADWPIAMIGGKTKDDRPNSLGKKIWKKYGFFGVPQLLLLDKQGRLVMLNDILRGGDFEPLIKKLLNE